MSADVFFARSASRDEGLMRERSKALSLFVNDVKAWEEKKELAAAELVVALRELIAARAMRDALQYELE